MTGCPESDAAFWSALMLGVGIGVPFGAVLERFVIRPAVDGWRRIARRSVG